MNRYTFFYLAIFILATLQVNSQDYNYKTLTIPKLPADASIEVDGVKEEIYASSEESVIERWNVNTSQGGVQDDKGEAYPGHSGSFWMVYDDDNVYLYCEITDDDFADDDEFGVGFDLSNERETYGWEGEPKDDNGFAFIGSNWQGYKDAGSEPMSSRGAEIFWVDNAPNWAFEIKIPWKNMTSSPAILQNFWSTETFLFDIGCKNKNSDGEDPGDEEYFQWSGNMNNFYQGSLLMGVVTLGDEASSTAAIHQSNNSKISVYPNPVNNILKIMNAGNAKNINLYSITGEKVATANQISNLIKIDTHNLNNGIYILQVDKEIFKIIIN